MISSRLASPGDTGPRSELGFWLRRKGRQTSPWLTPKREKEGARGVPSAVSSSRLILEQDPDGSCHLAFLQASALLHTRVDSLLWCQTWHLVGTNPNAS